VRSLVGTELLLRALWAVEEQLLLGTVVDPIGAPSPVIGQQPHQPALLARDHRSTQDPPVHGGTG
jgi:hypothetical protein